MNKNSTMPAAPSTSKDSIPLHCNICPKRPDFSDTSHLLTHIASKGHLSNYYKMKVKGSTDPASRELVEEYDDWYEEHNMQDLMRERMSQKEKKKVGGAGGNANGPAGSRRGSAGSLCMSRSSMCGGLLTRIRLQQLLLPRELPETLQLHL